MKNGQCAVCEAEALVPKIEMDDVHYKGKTDSIELHFSECTECGSELTDSAQARRNKRAMMAFKKNVDSILSGSEIRELRARRGLTQRQAAALFGGGPVAFSKYETDDVMQSEAMDKLLQVADEVPEAFEWLMSKSGIQEELVLPVSMPKLKSTCSEFEFIDKQPSGMFDRKSKAKNKRFEFLVVWFPMYYGFAGYGNGSCRE